MKESKDDSLDEADIELLDEELKEEPEFHDEESEACGD